jgi:hypothetical protein
MFSSLRRLRTNTDENITSTALYKGVSAVSRFFGIFPYPCSSVSFASWEVLLKPQTPDRSVLDMSKIYPEDYGLDS